MPKVLRIPQATAERRWEPQPSVMHVVPEGPAPAVIAAEIRRRAEEEAAEILANAVAEAERCRQHAYTEGFARGMAQAETQGQQLVRAKLIELENRADEINTAQETFLNSAERELVRLVVSIAERILTRQLTLAPEMVIDMIRATLARIHEREKVTIHLHPDDMALLQDELPALSTETLTTADKRELFLLEDLSVGRGGAMLETPTASYDLRLPSQLDTVRKALEEALEDAHEQDGA